MTTRPIADQGTSVPAVLSATSSPTDYLPPVLTLAETAAFLRSSKAHVSNLARGKVRGVPPLPVVRLGRRFLVQKTVLLEWLSRTGQGSVCH